MQVGKRAKKIIKHTFKHTINVIEIVPRKCNKKLRLLLEKFKATRNPILQTELDKNLSTNISKILVSKVLENIIHCN